MADSLRSSPSERDIEQAITALKKGAQLLKYGRRGKPKFCPFQLSNDESVLMWYSGKDEKRLKISQVSRIIPGQRTAIFQRYPRPEKEYQSFSLICTDRSLDLICKDKDEAEVWFAGLNALINRGNGSKWKVDVRSDSTSSESPSAHAQKCSTFVAAFDIGDAQGSQMLFDTGAQKRLGKAFSDIVSLTAPTKSPNQREVLPNSSVSLSAVTENSNCRISSETNRVSLSSAVSSSSQSSFQEDFDALGDVYLWGESIGDRMLDDILYRVGNPCSSKMNVLLPKALESRVVLDVHNIACGSRHAVLLTKQGEIFSWGEEAGGRLGHGVETDVPHPKVIDTLSGMNIELVSCGEYHTCAVTLSGDLYTWGDGTHNSGMLGHGCQTSHWIPRKVSGIMEGLHVSFVTCGTWHTAVVTLSGQLFTFGDGSFGALGHGDHSSTGVPREVETLKGLRTIRVACGVWHTAAVVEVKGESSSSPNPLIGQLFTWGDGDKGRLGHGDKESRLVPQSVAGVIDENICQVACGHNLTVALTTTGRVYTMGSTPYGQLGSSTADGKIPTLVKGGIEDSLVEEIACGSYHVAVLTSKTEVYTWGRGTNGQLGHGDTDDRNTPTLIEFLKDKQVKKVVCGSNFTAIICLHKWVSHVDHSVCSGCRNPFGFRRKRHNCYNCGLLFCSTCSSKKSLKASLAPNMNKPYRVCDDCFTKCKKIIESVSDKRTLNAIHGSLSHRTNEIAEKEILGPRLQTQISRLSSTDSVNQYEGRPSNHAPSNHDFRGDVRDCHVFPALNEKFQEGGFYIPRTLTSVLGAPKKNSLHTLPGSRVSSRALSPVSGKSSPPRSSAATVDDSHLTNDNVRKEVTSLKEQVEELTHKSQYLDGELERTSKQLKEVTAVATDEAEKCRSAQEIIQSLTAQLQEMSEKLQEAQSASSNIYFTTKHTGGVQNQLSSENHARRTVSHNNVSNKVSLNQSLPNRSKTQTEKGERVVQDEPGVYITLSPLPDGNTELKRVRFSRKRFTEEQAEKWWTENGDKVCERHNILSTE